MSYIAQLAVPPPIIMGWRVRLQLIQVQVPVLVQPFWAKKYDCNSDSETCFQAKILTECMCNSTKKKKKPLDQASAFLFIWKYLKRNKIKD